VRLPYVSTMRTGALPKVFLFTAATLLSTVSVGQLIGSNDPTFNPSDTGFGNGNGFNSAINEVLFQPDGKMVVCGSFTAYNAQPCSRIVRLNADGSLDGSFITGTGLVGTIGAIALQSDGRILVGGGFSSFNGAARNCIVRLNADGSVDPTYASPPETLTLVRDIAVQPDGQVLVVADSRQCRYSGAGIIDGTYASTTLAGVRLVVVQADGMVLEAGTFTGRLRRKSSAGLVEAGYPEGTGFNANIRHMALQPDGKLVLVGDFTTYNGTTRNRIIRLDPDGSLDAGFDTGTGFNLYASKVLVIPSGMWVAGSFSQYNGTLRNGLVRLGTDGALDAFDADIASTGTGDWQLAEGPTGKFFFGGKIKAYMGEARGSCVLAHPDGSLDTTAFADLGTGANERVRAVAVQPDGKVLIGGDFTAVNGAERFRIARLTENGELDPTFDPAAAFDGVVHCILVLPDGDIMVGGGFMHFNGIQRIGVARLNTDGTLDSAFNANLNEPTVFGVTVYDILRRSDGTLYLGGYFQTCQGITRLKVARVFSDGALDASFDPGSVAGNVFCLAERGSGQLLVAGDFTTFNGVTKGGLVQVLPTGLIDPAFNPGTGFTGITPWVKRMLLQADGKVIVVGWFVTFNGGAKNARLRLNTDGTLDNTFTSSTNQDRFDSVLKQPDGKLIFCGPQTSTYPFPGLLRTNANGVADPEFLAGAGIGFYPVNALCLASNGHLLIAGYFGAYRNIGRNGLARVYLSAPADGTVVPVRAFLQGPYNSGTSTMSDQLRAAARVPLAEPYTALGYAHAGSGGEFTSSAVLNVTGPDAIVDWVFLELRSAADPTHVVATRCALIQRDGDVVDVNGTSPVGIPVLPADYKVVLRHRNHLGVMSADAISVSGSTTLLDITQPGTPTYGTAAQNQVGGRMVLWSGDALGDGTLRYTGSTNDRDPILTAIGSTTPNNALTNQYSRLDTNLDTVVKYTGSGNDRDAILAGVGSTTPNSIRTQQLP